MRYKISNKVDFYVTNVCNLTCNNCNRFNNHDFKGWQSWSEYEESYERWGKLITLPSITIMGGEPLLNPTITDWVRGLLRIFDCDIQILTNGTRLMHVDGLYETMLLKTRNGCQNHMAMSLHNLKDWETIRADIYKFLKAPITEWHGENNKWGSDWAFEDVNGVKINVYISNQFFPASIQKTTTGTFRLHNNDPLLAHQNCAFVQFKSYHFIRGNLYKCGPVALMPEFEKQKTLEISDEDSKLLNSYRPLNPDNFAEYQQEFFENIDKPLAQCKFCSVSPEHEVIYPLRKGLKNS
jgi:organic radical activating enzyme